MDVMDADMGVMDMAANSDDEDNLLNENTGDESASDDDSTVSELASHEQSYHNGNAYISRPRFLAEREKARRLKLKLDAAKQQISELRRAGRLRRGQVQRRDRRTEPTWPGRRQQFLDLDPEDLGQYFIGVTYEDLVKLSAFEGNHNPRYTHPDLILREPSEAEEQGEPSSPQIGVDSTQRPRLGLLIEARVLQEVLCFDRGIHAISRLDPYYEPDTSQELPRDLSGALTYLRRYHVGSRSCSITFSAKRPNDLLAPPFTCRAWHFIGSHIYAKNRFIFSSLGELGRWCSGIGPKIALVSRIELFLVGSQHLTYKINDRGKYVSRRTQPLFHLLQCLRLRELCLYVRETAARYVRRRHETRGVIRYAKDMTHNQPNYRETRNLHCIQGLDYIYCLRGLSRVQFFDYDKWLTKRTKRVPVRDSAFVESIRSAVQREKQLQDYVRSRLRNLSPLLPGYDPPEEVWNCLEAIGVDILELDSGRVADSDDSESDDFTEEPTSLDSESDSDSDTDSDDSDSDDTKMQSQDEAQSNPDTDDERMPDAADQKASRFIDLTDDDDSGSMRQPADGSDGSRESSLFIGDPMPDHLYDHDIDQVGSPLGLRQEEPIEVFDDEESGLFVSDRSADLIDLTSDDEMG